MKKNNEITILQKKRNRLIDNFIKGREPAFTEKHALLFDEYFCRSFESSNAGPKINILKNPYAIIALGGYGRQEQCICSDIDLLFLFKKTMPDSVEDLIREFIYPLWDAGFEVGYATRSIKECINISADDPEVMISLMDGRFICGMTNLFYELNNLLYKKIIHPRLKKIISGLVEKNNERHRNFGDSTYLLEPNLKEGQGGLRDFHTMLWISRIKFNLKEPRDLEYSGYLSQYEYTSLKKAVTFILNTRNRLHYITGRRCDQLYFEHQIGLAEFFKFKKTKGHEAVEKFLGQLHGWMDLIKQRQLVFLAELGYSGTPAASKGILGKKTRTHGLEVKKNMLEFTSMEEIIKSPELLIQIFEESLRLKIPLSPVAKRVEKDLAYLINNKFRVMPPVIKSFKKILAAKASVEFDVLDGMLNTGFLQRLIPEFGDIVNRIQFNTYHLYPVDKHSLKTVQTIKLFGISNEIDQLCHDLFHEISHKKRLLWAALLHDIGKGRAPENHSETGAIIAPLILKRMGCGHEDIKTVSFLIKEHLFLVKTATRRDINDEGTAIYCARKIKNIETLKMLFILTVADSMSTGPKAWNNWTAIMLRDLFLKILRILNKGELATTRATGLVERKKEKFITLMSSVRGEKTARSYLDFMSPRYLLYISPEEIIEHVKLYETIGRDEFVLNISRDKEIRVITVCAKNRPGLFSRIAGVLTLNNLNILDSQIFTWRNNIALDIFRVSPPLDLILEDELWARAKKNLQMALSEDLDIAGRLDEKISRVKPKKLHTIKQPSAVNIDNEESSFFTIIEVFTYDSPGLLFKITDTIFKCGLDIQIAKISTKIDQVVDVFYVRNIDGDKVHSQEQIERIRDAIKKVLQDND